MESDAKQLDKKYKYLNKHADVPVDYSDKDMCCVNYEQEYYRQCKQLCEVNAENERLKQALINVALRLGDWRLP